MAVTDKPLEPWTLIRLAGCSGFQAGGGDGGHGVWGVGDGPAGLGVQDVAEPPALPLDVAPGVALRVTPPDLAQAPPDPAAA
jgi:hypothetical protein